MKNNQGTIIAMRGGVLEIEFEDNIPQIGSLLSSLRRQAVFEVVEKKDSRTIRAIALSSFNGVERGENVVVTNKEISVSLNKNIFLKFISCIAKENIPFNLFKKSRP